jgi:hypothetical protein
MPSDLDGWLDLISALSTTVVGVFSIALFWVGWRQHADTSERAEYPDDEKYLYVCGRAKFKDGCCPGRWIDFCHRYPWAKRKLGLDGDVTISKRWARYHHLGNKAN